MGRPRSGERQCQRQARPVKCPRPVPPLRDLAAHATGPNLKRRAGFGPLQLKDGVRGGDNNSKSLRGGSNSKQPAQQPRVRPAPAGFWELDSGYKGEEKTDKHPGVPRGYTPMPLASVAGSHSDGNGDPGPSLRWGRLAGGHGIRLQKAGQRLRVEGAARLRHNNRTGAWATSVPGTWWQHPSPHQRAHGGLCPLATPRGGGSWGRRHRTRTCRAQGGAAASKNVTTGDEKRFLPSRGEGRDRRSRQRSRRLRPKPSGSDPAREQRLCRSPRNFSNR